MSQNPNGTSIVEVDKKTMRSIIRQYIGKTGAVPSKFAQKRKQIINKKLKNRKKLLVFPILQLQRPLYENQMFYLFGGVMLPSDFSLEGGEIVASRTAFRSSFQKTVCIENKQNQTILHFTSPFLGLKSFQFLIDIYNRKGKQNYKNLAVALEKFQNNITQWQNSDKKKSKQFINADQYNLKVQEFYKSVYQMADEFDQSKFYIFGIVIYDYEKEDLQQRTVGYSKGYLSLIGTDQEQFTSMNIRRGLSWNNAGELVIDSLIISLSPLSGEKFQNGKTESETVLVTLDGFFVPCRELKQYFIPKESVELGYIEMGFAMIEFDVSLNQIKQLLQLRSNRYNNPTFENSFNYFSGDDFEYSMNSSLFLEKFYSKTKAQDFYCCKYRYINQLSPNLSPQTPIDIDEKEKKTDPQSFIASTNSTNEQESCQESHGDYFQLFIQDSYSD